MVQKGTTMKYEIIADGKKFFLDNTNIEELDADLEFIPQIQDALKGSRLVGLQYLNEIGNDEDNSNE